MSKALEIANLNKVFLQGNQSIQALENVSLTVNKSEIVSLVGPSGSGKTTLLQIAGLLDDASSGKIFINEINVSKSNDKIKTKIRRENIGFIFQFHHLLPEFSALENVAMPLLIRGFSYKEATKQAKNILQEVELSNRINHKTYELSGGQQQRVAIARAIICKPSLILADEPTGNLDSELSVKIFHLLQNLTTSYNIGCLLVTHNEIIANQTNRILKIKDGKIV
jgi:lipoprotein-releasing system ATP-binding protein